MSIYTATDDLVLLAVLRERAVRHSDEIPPPYLFPDAVDEPFPGMPATTIGETLHGVWQSAHEQIVEIIDGLIDFERAKGFEDGAEAVRREKEEQ